jgi:hypothetical protein
MAGMTPLPHPMRGANRFKLGVFSANADGGLTLTRVPERWRAGWDERAAVARLADAGFAGTTVSFVNVRDELPFFIATVLPLLRDAGLRSQE